MREKEKLLNRIRRILGQAINGFTAEIIEDHIRLHVFSRDSQPSRGQAAEELVEVVNTYLK